MKGIYEMSLQLTLPLTTNATSSPASEPGATPCGGQGGPMTDQSGQEVVHASLSARQAKEAGLMTSGTYGPHGFGSLSSQGLASSLASKLAARTALLGSTLFRLIWKVRVTPSGHSIYALRASAPRTSGSGCTSWPTPNAMDGGQTSRGGDRKGELLMGGLVQPASWPTPQGADGTRGSKTMQRRGTNYTMKGAALQVDSGETPRATEIVTGQNAQAGLGLTSTAQMTTWATPTARDWRDGRASQETMGRSSRPLNEQAVQLADSGETPNGSPAGMERPGQLNPALPRWLMGYPEIFDHCSPGWKEWAIAQRKLEECSGDPEALWLWLARIALEDCGDTATGL